MSEPPLPRPAAYAVLPPGREAAARIEVTRSVFAATLVRADDEAAARALVARARAAARDARHHCTAFVLGPPGPGRVERSSDDGEPSGTAGAPMLEVLRASGLGDAAVVVTRWFGGTLLGAGGLVRAYGEAVRAAVEESRPTWRTRTRLSEWTVDLDHALAARVESDLRARGVPVLEVAYGERVRVVLGVAGPASEAEGLRDTLAGLTAGGAVPRLTGERWADL